MIIAIWISCFLFQTISAEIKLTKFRRPVTDSQTGAKANISARSKIECAGICAKDDHCVSFYFDKSTLLCHVADAIMNVPLDTMYSKEDYPEAQQTEGPLSTETTTQAATQTTVPATTTAFNYPNTYTAHVIDNKNYYLRLVDTEATKADAEAACQADGAHLITIENEIMHLYIKAHLESKNSDSRWIDGQDFFSNDTMLTWDMRAIPYVKWADKQPGGGNDDCLLLSRFLQFHFRDIRCSYQSKYICQIC